jgi:hypothetical protein
MLKKFQRALMVAATFAATWAVLPSASAAVVLQGEIGQRMGQAYVAEFVDVRDASTGAAVTESAVLICIDMYNHFPDSGTTHSYTVMDGGPSIVHASATGRAIDLFHYAVDRFYDSMVVNSTSPYAGYQFSAMIWEIEKDFNGQVSSLDGTAGTVYTGMLGMSDQGAIYQSMVDTLRSEYTTVADGYRSEDYSISFLDDAASGYQSMMMLTPTVATAEVPEPATLALVLLGALPLVRRRKQAA